MQTHFTDLDGLVLAGYFLATMADGFYSLGSNTPKLASAC